MKQNIVVLSVLFCLAGIGSANAQEEKDAKKDEVRTTFALVDVDYVLREESSEPAVAGLLTQPFSRDSVAGIMGFARVTSTGAKAYTGPVLLLGPLTLGVGIGMETHSEVWRAGVAGMLTTNPITAYAALDVGGSGLWWQWEALWHPRKWIGFGAMAEYGEGLGPRVEIIPLGKILSLHMGFMKPRWGSPGYTSIIGFRLRTD